MKFIHFEGYLEPANESVETIEQLEDKLLDILTESFNEELETVSCGIEEVEDDE